MTSIELPEIELEFKLPEVVEEMSQEQYLAFIDTLAEAGVKGWDEERLCFELLYHFSPITRGENRLDIESAATLSLISSQLKVLFTDDKVDGKLVRIPRLQTAMAMVKSFTHNGETYYGPADALSNSSFGEFIASFYTFQDYHNNRDEKFLIKLAAILFRPGSVRRLNEDGDARVPYVSAQVKGRIQEFESLPKNILKAVLYFYAGFQDYLQNGMVRIGGNDIEFKVLFNGKGGNSKTSLPSQGWVDVLFQLSESGVFGNLKATENQNVFTIFSRLYQLHREQKEQELRNKKKSQK